jgi:hypothetical protein
MGALSRRKGHNWERAVAKRFREVFPDARRGTQTRQGYEAPDVETPVFWIEAKVGRRTNPKAALAQALEAMSNNPEAKGLIPIAVCKDDRCEPTVTLGLEDFLELVGEWWRARA